jgi:signal transduction histidine kinase
MRRAFLCLILLLLVPPFVTAQSVVPRTSNAIELGAATALLRDRDGTIDLDAARRAWREGRFSIAPSTPRYRAGDRATWLRVEFDLTADPARSTRLFELEAVRPSLVDLTVFDAQDEATPLATYSGGIAVPGSAYDRLFAIKLGSLPATRLVVYGRIVSDYAPELTSRLVTAEDVAARERSFERLLGPLEGAVLALSVLLLALWGGQREKLLPFGAFLVLSALTVVHMLLGQDRHVWPALLQAPLVNEMVFLAAISALLGCALRFTEGWLATRSYAPRLGSALLTASVLLPVLLLGGCIASPRFALLVLTLVVATALLLLLSATAAAARARVPGVWLYFVFGSPMMIGLAIRLAAANGLLRWADGMPYMSFFTLAALSLGIAFGLADASRRKLLAMVELRTQQLANANEELQRLSDGRNRLLGVVAHDVRAPLASMVTAAELLRTGKLAPEEAPSLLDLVAANGRATLAMLEDLLDLSAIEGGTIPIELRPTDVRAVLQERVRLLQPLLNTREIRIDGVALEALADPLRLGQALDNLLSNAAKFSPETAPIDLHLHRIDGHALLDVADRGSGLTESELQRLFTPFAPGDRRPVAGRSTGLGLAIVKRLIELQQGRIEVHPRAGGGTIFRIRLKAA